MIVPFALSTAVPIDGVPMLLIRSVWPLSFAGPFGMAAKSAVKLNIVGTLAYTSRVNVVGRGASFTSVIRRVAVAVVVEFSAWPSLI